MMMMMTMMCGAQVSAAAPVPVDALGELVKTSPSCWRTFCALVYIRTVRMIRDPYKLYVMIFMPISKLLWNSYIHTYHSHLIPKGVSK
jgi:hypothetical protein